jgi:HSP20 family protein
MPEVKVSKELAKTEKTRPALFNEFFMPERPFSKLPVLSPFALMREFAHEMDRLFKEGPKFETDLFVPAIDVKATDEALVVTADLPGLKKEEIKIEVTEKSLVIEGERKIEEKEEKPGFHKIERAYGKFYREIPLPEGAKIDLAKADLTNGVLTVAVPIPPIAKARPVPIEEGGKNKTKTAVFG